MSIKHQQWVRWDTDTQKGNKVHLTLPVKLQRIISTRSSLALWHLAVTGHTLSKNTRGNLALLCISH